MSMTFDIGGFQSSLFSQFWLESDNDGLKFAQTTAYFVTHMSALTSYIFLIAKVGKCL